MQPTKVFLRWTLKRLPNRAEILNIYEALFAQLLVKKLTTSGQVADL